MSIGSQVSFESLRSGASYPDQPPSIEDEAQAVVRILAQVVDIVRPRSLLDVGQGPGYWARAAGILGLEGASGVDTAGDEEASVAVPGASRRGERLRFARRFDLVVALGMTEGLSSDDMKAIDSNIIEHDVLQKAGPIFRHHALIGDLCLAGDVILFSSPDPLLGSAGDDGHWPDYWATLFREKNYHCFDLFGRQPSLNDEPDRLKQNVFVYARHGSEAADRLMPWIVDGLVLASYAPDAVLALMAGHSEAVPARIAAHRRRYRDEVVARAAGSGFLAPGAALRRSKARDQTRTETMGIIERRAGLITGERLGFDRGWQAQRAAADARRLQERAHHAEDIAELEDELNHLRATIDRLSRSPLRRAFNATIGDAGHHASLDDLGQRRRGRERQRQIDIIRMSTLFDVDWYLDANPDVEGYDPIEHYLDFGANEGRDPSPVFDTKAYLDAHPDLGRLNLNPFVHYIQGLAGDKALWD